MQKRDQFCCKVLNWWLAQLLLNINQSHMSRTCRSVPQPERGERREGGKQQGSHFSPQASHLFDPLHLIPSSNTVLTSKVSPYLQLIKGEFCLSSPFSGIPWPGLEFDLCHSCQQMHFLLLPCFCFYLRQLSEPERKHARTEQGDTGASQQEWSITFPTVSRDWLSSAEDRTAKGMLNALKLPLKTMHCS